MSAGKVPPPENKRLRMFSQSCQKFPPVLRKMLAVAVNAENFIPGFLFFLYILEGCFQGRPFSPVFVMAEYGTSVRFSELPEDSDELFSGSVIYNHNLRRDCQADLLHTPAQFPIRAKGRNHNIYLLHLCSPSFSVIIGMALQQKKGFCFWDSLPCIEYTHVSYSQFFCH